MISLRSFADFERDDAEATVTGFTRPSEAVEYALTAHIEYSFNTWNTEASGFLFKPITTETVQTSGIRFRRRQTEMRALQNYSCALFHTMIK